LSPSPKALAATTAALAAIALGLVSYAAGAWPRLENDAIDVRFAVRGPTPAPPEVIVVAIDENSFSELRAQWPFGRAMHAAVVERLRADRAKVIAYDVQFTEPSHSESEDLALYHAVAKAHDVVLATTEVDAGGRTDVLGGEQNLREAHAVAAASNLPADSGGVIRRYPYALLGLPSFATAVAEAAGGHVNRSSFTGGSALIDFRGSTGTITTVSFSDVLRGRVPARMFAGKIVVVGVSAPTLQDVHLTSTASSDPMSGPEIQANAIWTALHGNPLRAGPPWLVLLAMLLLGSIAPLASMRLRVLAAALVALALAVGYLVFAQLEFDSGTVLTVTYPLAALAAGTIGMIAANYSVAFLERNAFERQLRESQLELIQRLANAIESRDVETGEHIQRIGARCERLALAIGWSAPQAEMLRHASIMHDVGKIGIPDSVLLKPGGLSPEEWEIVKQHTTIGGDMLAGSANPLVQMAQDIARSHHERWDGSGYPDGLAGEQIPLPARICAIVDVYDALLSKRVYKEAWSLDQVLAELRRQSGSQFDPALMETFLELVPQIDYELDLRLGHDIGLLRVGATC
jgi:CHASE2 domain-containing sensor protein